MYWLDVEQEIRNKARDLPLDLEIRPDRRLETSFMFHRHASLLQLLILLSRNSGFLMPFFQAFSKDSEQCLGYPTLKEGSLESKCETFLCPYPFLVAGESSIHIDWIGFLMIYQGQGTKDIRNGKGNPHPISCCRS